MSRIPSKPIYLVPKDDPVVSFHKEMIELASDNKDKKFNIIVPPDVVGTGDVSVPQQFILALQHYPQCIESLLFSFEFKFEEIADGELYLQELDWKGHPKYMRWFCKMHALPLTLFFINDHDARFYLLAGDLLADGNLKIEQEKEIGNVRKAKLRFEREHIELLAGRLYNSCWMLLMYCHGSGFYPKTYIESVLADYNLPVHYEQIYKNYISDVKKGVTLRAVGE